MTRVCFAPSPSGFLHELAERLAGLNDFNEQTVEVALSGRSVYRSAFAIFTALAKGLTLTLEC